MMHRLLVPILLALSTGAAVAEAERDVHAPRLVVIRAECLPYFTLPTEQMSIAAWNDALSFAACAQDASTYRVTSTDDLSELVGRMQEALTPSLEIYADAIQRAPGAYKLRAAFQIGMAELGLVTRARASIPPGHAAVHAALEPLLRPQAKLAWLSFSVVANAASDDPSLVPDAVTQYMARTAREHARLLGTSWGFEPDQRERPALTRNSSSAQPGSN